MNTGCTGPRNCSSQHFSNRHAKRPNISGNGWLTFLESFRWSIDSCTCNCTTLHNIVLVLQFQSIAFYMCMCDVCTSAILFQFI